MPRELLPAPAAGRVLHPAGRLAPGQRGQANKSEERISAADDPSLSQLVFTKILLVERA